MLARCRWRGAGWRNLVGVEMRTAAKRLPLEGSVIAAAPSRSPMNTVLIFMEGR